MNNPESNNIVNRPSPTFLQLLGETLLTQFFMVYLSVAVHFLVGKLFGVYTFPVALLTGAAIACFGTRLSTSIKVLCSSLGCWLISLLIGALVMDCSYDGNAYHQEIVAAIARGWVPGGAELPGAPLSLWAHHYAKGIEMAEACVVKCTGMLESGKAVNTILALSAALIVSVYARRQWLRMRNLPAAIIGLMVVLNPVVLCQSITYYIDFVKYIFTLLTIIYLLQLSSDNARPRDWFCLAMLILLASASKFNAFFEEGVVVFAAFIWLVVRGRGCFALRLGVFSLVCAAFGAIVLSYHPYVTNWLEAGHPLYPLMGEGRADIMTGNTPEEYLGRSRFVAFFTSLFTVAVPNVDTRIGGFGPFMPYILIISLVVVWKYRKAAHGLTLYISGWIVASCFFFEQSWWARYICQLWILPVMATMLLASSPTRSQSEKWMLRALVFFAVAGGILGLCWQGGSSVRQSIHRKSICTVLRGDTLRVTNLNEAYTRQLQEYGIEAVSSEDVPDSPFRLAYYGRTSEPTQFPIMLLDSVQYASVISELSKAPFDYTKNITSKQDNE